ncbi:MAG: nucleoside triphosphatase YtkD, partial [Bacillota bacterium]|nr:nucleoside triphosphatase YtkD [Bacillota bacterium]
MNVFYDYNGNKVELSFDQNPFNEEAMHVLVLCRFGDDWLLTNHKQRGFEFPGGKREYGETLEDAARREVQEETGASLSELVKLGEYRVTFEEQAFVKAIFFAQVEQLETKAGYLETNGPVFVKGDLLHLRFQDDYSFIMKDGVIEACLKK